MTREVRPDYNFSERCLNSVKKRRKLPQNFFFFFSLSLFPHHTLCYNNIIHISKRYPCKKWNLFALGSSARLSSPSNCPARSEVNGANAHIVKWTIGQCRLPPPSSLLTDGAGDTWTATRLHLWKLTPRWSARRNNSRHLCNRRRRRRCCGFGFVLILPQMDVYWEFKRRLWGGPGIASQATHLEFACNLGFG